MSLPKVGSKIPKFILKNQDGSKVSLDNYGGKNIILYFYPKAMTSGCTIQAQGLRDFNRKLNSNNIAVIGISPDDPDKLLKFVQKEKLNFELLSDSDLKICKKFGVWGEKKFMGKTFMGVKRTTFIVDKKGVLQHIMENVKTKTHHMDAFDWIKNNL